MIGKPLGIAVLVLLILTLSALGIAFTPLSIAADGNPPLCRFCGFHCRIHLLAS